MIQPLDVMVMIFLFFQSIWDMRNLEAEPVSLAVTGVTGFFYLILELKGGISFALLTAFMPGLFILILSLLSRGKIGLGDAWVTLTLGFFADMPKIMAAVILGSLASFLSAAVLVALGRRSKEDALPFLPFLLAGYGAALMLSVP